MLTRVITHMKFHWELLIYPPFGSRERFKLVDDMSLPSENIRKVKNSELTGLIDDFIKQVKNEWQKMEI